MEAKKAIESHVVKMFLKQTEGKDIAIEDRNFGNDLKNEPDILYEKMGIEIGAVLKGKNTHIDTFEEKFLSIATKSIENRIPETIQIRLVMQLNRNEHKYTPTSEFQEYKYLTKYLTSVFINIHAGKVVENKIVLNQKSEMREGTFPSNKENNREFIGFINELVEIVEVLNKPYFRGQEIRGNSIFKLIAKGERVKPKPHPLLDFISPKIIDKLAKDKYSGNYTKQILLLHNYSDLGNSNFTTDIHFYTHYRNEIFNFIWEKIGEYKSFNVYDSILFLDFSNYSVNRNFDLIDFHSYSLRESNKHFHDSQIRCDMGSMVRFKNA